LTKPLGGGIIHRMSIEQQDKLILEKQRYKEQINWTLNQLSAFNDGDIVVATATPEDMRSDSGEYRSVGMGTRIVGEVRKKLSDYLDKIDAFTDIDELRRSCPEETAWYFDK